VQRCGGRNALSRRWAVVHACWRQAPVTPTPRAACQRPLYWRGCVIEETGSLNPLLSIRRPGARPIEMRRKPSPTCHGWSQRSDWPDLARRAHPLLEAWLALGTAVNPTASDSRCFAWPRMTRLGAAGTAADRRASTAPWRPRCWPAGRCVRVPDRPEPFDVWFGLLADYGPLDSSRGVHGVVDTAVANDGFGATALITSRAIERVVIGQQAEPRHQNGLPVGTGHNGPAGPTSGPPSAVLALDLQRPAAPSRVHPPGHAAP